MLMMNIWTTLLLRLVHFAHFLSASSPSFVYDVMSNSYLCHNAFKSDPGSIPYLEPYVDLVC